MISGRIRTVTSGSPKLLVLAVLACIVGCKSTDQQPKPLSSNSFISYWDVGVTDAAAKQIIKSECPVSAGWNLLSLPTGDLVATSRIPGSEGQFYLVKNKHSLLKVESHSQNFATKAFRVISDLKASENNRKPNGTYLDPSTKTWISSPTRADRVSWTIPMKGDEIWDALRSELIHNTLWESGVAPSGGFTFYRYTGPEVDDFSGMISLTPGKDNKHCTLNAAPLNPEVRKVLRVIHSKLHLKDPITFY